MFPNGSSITINVVRKDVVERLDVFSTQHQSKQEGVVSTTSQVHTSEANLLCAAGTIDIWVRQLVSHHAS